jgi:serine/threonine-protein kinase
MTVSPTDDTRRREVTAWLAELNKSALNTLADDAGATIVPGPAASDAKRALGMLADLAGADSSAGIEMVPGAVLGEGGMGVVQLANQLTLERTVAVKTVREDRKDEKSALELLREAWVTGMLEHPNIVPVYHLGIDADGHPKIVFKKITGMHWGELMLNQDTLRHRFGVLDPLAWNIDILLQVLNAIRFAHSRGILHRDIKPENVMIGEFGEVYLLDWGLAVSVRGTPGDRLPLAADQRTMAGTPVYMAPEMMGTALSDHALSERTDLYLAGAVLYTIVTGAPPHMGTTPIEVMTKVVASRPDIPESVPPELAKIVRKCMRPDPTRRYQSADDLQAALRGYLRHRSSEDIATVARDRLIELERAIAGADTIETDREHVYRLLGACRFGFRQALSTWSDNDEARDGLNRATIATATWELAAGHPQAAVNLLSELPEAPVELVARARNEATAQKDRAKKLDALEAKLDWSVGSTARIMLALTFGASVSAFPLIRELTGWFPSTLNTEIATTGALLVSYLTLGVVFQDMIRTTVVNKRVYGSVAVLLTTQILLGVGFKVAGLSLVVTHLAMFIMWATVAGCMTVALEVRLWPTAVGYLAAFFAAAKWPEQRDYFMSAGNSIVTLTALWLWWPRRASRADD